METARGIRSDERLRRLESVTDAALSRLDVADLLDELLERVVDLLGVDTAVVLLLDEHTDHLVVTAAKGLEDEVRQSVRVPVGHGFAGRVAANRRPLTLAEVTAADVVSPILLQKGVRSLLGVPMLAGGDLAGVLHVGSLIPRLWTDDDVELLQLVADRAASAGQARTRRLDQVAAMALQRSLLPARLPAAAGLDLAARYVPGNDLGVGGDWYDVFGLPSGWLGVVVGDVSGHGLGSAVIMGRVRSALRSYALICDDPAEALTLLDRKIVHFEAGQLTTVLYAMISPDRSAAHVSLAGHLRPVVAAPGEPARLADVRVDPPAGTRPARGRARRTTVVGLPPGAVLVCYTDGLVERRGEIIDEGIERLLAATSAAPADAVCDAIMAAGLADRPTDDVAMLVLRRTGGAVPR